MNLLNGLTTNQIWSVALSFLLFGGISTLVIVILVSFYLTSRPRGGRVWPRGPMWHLVALFWVLWSEIAMVWAAPAENAFVNANGDNVLFELSYDHFVKVLISIVFAAIAFVCLAWGWYCAISDRRRAEARPTTSTGVSSRGGIVVGS